VKKRGEKAPTRRYVALYHAEIDSMAFKTLSPAAVWLLVQIRRAWRGSNDNIELPFSRVSWRLTYWTFDRARRELEEAGFLKIVDPGGRPRRPARYALVESWCSEVAKRLANEDGAGYFRNIRTKDGRLVSVWYPARRRRTSAENAATARAVKAGKVSGPVKRKKAVPKRQAQKQIQAEDIEQVRAQVSRAAPILAAPLRPLSERGKAS